MPGRCSQEKGTAEARSGERKKRWWNGEGAGEKDGNEKERPEEAQDEDDDEEEADVGTAEEEYEDDGRSCLRRRSRRRVAAVAGAAGGGDAEGLGIAVRVRPCRVSWCGRQSRQMSAGVSGGAAQDGRAASGFYGVGPWAMAREVT